MCTYYYLHQHHISPCQRPIDFLVHYELCAAAFFLTDRPAQPCGRLVFDAGRSVDCANPCAAATAASAASAAATPTSSSSSSTTGSGSSRPCLVRPECAAGSCRLEDLGGRWRCCRCGRGGNTRTWCAHPLRSSPDTFCYHPVCQGCTVDAGQ